MGSSGFWQELRRRVCRITAACAVVGWVVIQSATQLSPIFCLRDRTARTEVIPIGFVIRGNPRFEAPKKYAAAKAVVASAAGS